MTLNELKYLIALAQTKHFGHAAKLVHISQPSLSIAIKKLEADLGIQLFERYLNEVRITRIGEQIIAQAQHILHEVERLKVIASGDQKQLKVPLRIGAIYTVGSYLFPLLIPILKNLAPEMSLLIQEDYTGILAEKLISGELDAILVSTPFQEPQIVTQVLYDESLVALMRTDHPLANQSELTPDQLKNEEILLLGPGHCFREKVLELCPFLQNQTGLYGVIEGTSFSTIIHMVASGLGITILPAYSIQKHPYSNLLTTRPFKNCDVKRQVALAWRMSFTRGHAINALQNAILTAKKELKA